MSKHTAKPPAKQLPSGIFEIALTRGYVTIVDAIDVDLQSLNLSVTMAGSNHKYAVYGLGNRKGVCGIHRIILSRMIGRDLVKGECVDHIDGNGLNNRRDNLRLATHAENMKNRALSKNNTTGFKGVFLNRNHTRYVAKITTNKKEIRLGTYDTPEEAHRAYCEAAVKYHGKFARFK